MQSVSQSCPSSFPSAPPLRVPSGTPGLANATVVVAHGVSHELSGLGSSPCVSRFVLVFSEDSLPDADASGQGLDTVIVRKTPSLGGDVTGLLEHAEQAALLQAVLLPTGYVGVEYALM